MSLDISNSYPENPGSDKKNLTKLTPIVLWETVPPIMVAKKQKGQVKIPVLAYNS